MYNYNGSFDVILEIREVYSKYSKTKIKRLIVIKCDNCGTIKERKYVKKYYDEMIERKYVGCTKSCSSKLQRVYMTDDVRLAKSEKIRAVWANVPDEERTKRNRAAGIATWSNKTQEERIEIADKIRKTLQEYNENLPLVERVRINAKIIETQKKNKSIGCRVSKIELKIKQLLEGIFTGDDREHWKFINNRTVDFYIKSLEVYLEIDGIYWHGLDRSLEEIRSSAKERDKRIFDGYLRDRKQDKWFLENNLKLSRITDIEAELLTEENVVEYIYKKIVREV